MILGNPALTPHQTKRDLLLDSAQALFAREGFHATGIDRILGEAGVAKMTLYNHFGSKEQLVVEVVDRASLALVARMVSWASPAHDPFEKIMLVFGGLGGWFESPDRCGCLLQGAAAEFSDPDSPVGLALLRHQNRVGSVFGDITRATECPGSDALARRLNLLFAGAWSASRLCRCRQPADEAAQAAAILLEDACRKAHLDGE